MKKDRYFYPAVFGYDPEEKEISEPTKLADIKTDENEKTVLIDVFMATIHMAQNNKSVNRTVTLPAWLNTVALECGINFSQLLQEAIRTQLKLEK